MARPKSTGFDYFPFDSSFFNDIKIRKLKKYGWHDAITVYIALLCMIFKEGYYLEIDEDLPFLICEMALSDEDDVKADIEHCVSVGLFDKELYEKGILTSIGIQKRYREISKRSKRITDIEEYNLLDENEEVSSEETQHIDMVSSEETTDISGLFVTNDTQECESSEETPQSKVNKSKVNNTPPISKEIDPPLENVEVSKPKLSMKERAHKFGEQLIPYIDKYGKTMIRDFYDFWTAFDEGDTKMAFEKAKTRSKAGVFNIPRRLATWKRIEDEKATKPQSKFKKGSTIIEALEAVSVPIVEPEELDVTKLIGKP